MKLFFSVMVGLSVLLNMYLIMYISGKNQLVTTSKDAKDEEKKTHIEVNAALKSPSPSSPQNNQPNIEQNQPNKPPEGITQPISYNTEKPYVAPVYNQTRIIPKIIYQTHSYYHS